MSSALGYVRACYPLMIPDETCTVVTPVQARGICFIGKKNAIFVVGGVRYLPITAEMKSYELFPKCAILLKTSKSTANDISSKKTLSNKNERNDVVILFSDLIKSIRKKHIDIITSIASENLFRIIKVNIMLENIKNHAVLYIRSIKYLFWYKKRRNFSLQLNKNLNKLTCPLPT